MSGEVPALTPFEWTVIGLVAGAAFTLICYLLKRTMNHIEKRTEDNATELQKVKDGSVSKETFDKTTQQLASDVDDIKQTYITRVEHKDDLKAVKDEIKDTTRKLTQDVEEIKENYLTQQNFYRVQAKTDQQLDKIYDVLLELVQKGDKSNGRE